MSGDVDGVAPRPRPLSGGLWTLLSWLRRDERDSSSESISSAGSDRTAASFAFLTPAHYSVGNTTNVLPALGPPTDSYKKRVHERNVRRQYERDLTLHRKYGLYRSEGGTGYDTFTLQQYRRTDGDSIGKWGRERRAASECLQRPSVHVPGKRRAPLPPVCPASSGASVTFARRTRKRPAPQPPLNALQKPKENNNLDNISAIMSSNLNRGEHSVTMSDTAVDCKSEKYVKKDANHKDTKTRSEKSFLKQIFENRKRNSTTDMSSIKILPSISELDKQAAEIIGRRKVVEQNRNIFGMELKNMDPQGSKIKEGSWFCTKCLKKYNASVEECFYCFPKLTDNTVGSIMNLMPYLKNEIYTQTDKDLGNPSTSRHNKIEDKQKLKEILKEMKDSLPKRSKHEKESIGKIEKKTLTGNSIKNSSVVSETPTLRIGSLIHSTEYLSPHNEPSSSGVGQDKNLTASQITRSKVPNITHVELKQRSNLNLDVKSFKGNAKNTELFIKLPLKKGTHDNSSEKNDIKGDISNLPSNSSGKRDLHTPLRISSLLNPVYIPKISDSNKQLSKEAFLAESTSPLLKTDIKNKPDTTIRTMVTLDGGTSNVTPTSVSITQMNTLSIETPKLRTEMNESTIQPILTTLKTEVKVEDNTENKVQLKRTLLNNDISPINEEKINFKTSESSCKEKKITGLSSVLPSPVSLGNISVLPSNLERVNQHVRRRELVDQLEKSIAKGDESAAADAAVKLAQLRLSCSVLSFSSQIVTDPSTSTQFEMQVNKNSKTQEEKDKAKKPLNKFESENKNTRVQPPILKRINATPQKLTSLSINEEKLVQSVKEEATVFAEQNESTKSKIVIKNKDVVSQVAASAEIETLEENIHNNVSIQVWVEDKEAARGPILLNTRRQAVMGELRIQAEAALGLPTRLQRWIVGRALCTNDNIPLVTLAGPEFKAPFYLCLVDPGQSDGNKPSTSRVEVGEEQTAAKMIRQNTVNAIGPDNLKAISQNNIQGIVQDAVKIMMQNDDQAANVYNELVKLEKQALVPNPEAFECGVCMDECLPDRGVVLRECVHMFCRDCLADLVRHCEEPNVICPATDCRGMLQEREIRGLVSSEDYERWLAQGLAAAESGTRNAFHCRTRDCIGWALCDPGVQKFPCPVCNHTNCVPCQAIHECETCENYRAKLQSVTNVDLDQIDVSTRALIDALINKGEALECPECKAVITKKWGCDWVKCSACKTEICWVTRGRRWGPAGRGDTSAGCRCGIDGKKCHPSCGYCH